MNVSRGGTSSVAYFRLKQRVVPIILILIAIASTAALFFGLKGGGESPIPGLPAIPDLSDLLKTDQWDEEKGTKARWRNNGRDGLSLTIINHLSERWYPFFDQAVSDWDGGDPDALTLITDVDPPLDESGECSRVFGKMNICNGDYGNTDWLGINEVFINANNFITHSVAKLNEYHMASASDGAKQYLMCHEIGHGFGLGHRDENFWNWDLGTCMDYTHRKSKNQSPNNQDFVDLSKKYGNVTEAIPIVPTLFTKRKKKKGKFRFLRTTSGSRTNGDMVIASNTWPTSIPLYTSFADSTAHERRSKWRLLKHYEENRGALHELDLGGGFKVHAHVLHVDALKLQ